MSGDDTFTEDAYEDDERHRLLDETNKKWVLAWKQAVKKKHFYTVAEAREKLKEGQT
jgi:hypothetical protein